MDRSARRLGTVLGLWLGAIMLCPPLSAQSARPLKAIGTTSVGTPVFLEPGSVSRKGTVVTAAVRVRLQPPLKHPNGDLRSSRTIAMYDCARQTVATKASWYYHDDDGRKEGMHRVVKTPGFGPAFKGSLAAVAMMHLCTSAR
ncbi:MAG: surface-adhesin E family protein [Gemmatimonadaceae bacterium]